MITNVSLFTLNVSDQDEAKKFYTDVLGFEERADECRKTYEELSAKGVDFVQPPSERPYGVKAVMRDNSGNWLVLVEPSSG